MMVVGWFSWQSAKQGWDWFESAMLARDLMGNTMLFCRSMAASNLMVARLMTIRQSFERLKRQGAERLWCKSGGEKWMNPLQGKMRVDWRLQPLCEDIRKLRGSFVFSGVFSTSHPLNREAKKMADRAATNRVPFSWPQGLAFFVFHFYLCYWLTALDVSLFD
ncbi:hypothetical protein COLO4_38121 [Corchorus olitorius]|uniref:RNase H type-1 domain-containing protein n=1 Tax=Corchorus olitorius TaxID=93759 RepID=A0A1R3FWU9_9ROSI|nr:hypothetical protein COLO4_38121 [Corchorus olitorius]